MGKKLEITLGQKFNRLTIIEEVEKKGTMRYVKCQCDCGVIKNYQLYHIKDNRIVSCGCIMKTNPSQLKHGHTKNNKGIIITSKTYTSWYCMKRRCLYSKSLNYHLYGGRGITVCERWMTFENFLADMGERPEGTTLDRIDPNGNYEPNNCRWATPKEQRQNQR